MIKRIFSSQINSITIAALLVALSSLLSRFLGIFRDRILASQFGAGDFLDVYYAAFRIPDLMFNLLVLGALSAGFIPIFSALINCKDENKELAKKNQKDAWELASNVLNVMAIFLFFLSVIGFIFAPWFTKLITPGFSPVNQDLTVELTRIMLLSPIFLGVSTVLGGILQSYKNFFVYSLSPIMYNIGIILGALYFVPLWGIFGLAWGVALGAFFHMLVQIPAVLYLGYRYRFILKLKDANLIKISKMMIPRTMSLAISQINLFIITIVASTLPSGSLSVFNFANNLQSLPIGVFGISFAIAAFPTFSVIAFDKKKLISNFSSIFRQILFFIVPSMVLLLTLRAQIIRVILGSGQFDWEDTILTIRTLGFFTLSLFAQATIPLMVRVFYARHNSNTPFFIGLISAIMNVFLSYWLSKSMGVAGLALAFSVSSIVNFVLLWLAMHIELDGMDEAKILLSIFKFSMAALACGLSVQSVKIAIWPFINMEKLWGVLVQGLSSGIFGILIYFLICALMDSEEFFSFWNSLRRRLPWKKLQTNDQGEARGI